MDTFFKLNADEAAATVDRYCAATALLPKNVLHNPQTAGGGAALRDAAEFLTPLVSWRGRAGSFQLLLSLTSKLQDAKDTWATAVVPADVAGIDLTWMSQLLDDDVWGVATAGPLVDSATTVSPFETPLPIYASLVEIAKVRYLQALAQGNIAQATREVRHFAEGSRAYPQRATDGRSAPQLPTRGCRQRRLCVPRRGSGGDAKGDSLLTQSLRHHRRSSGLPPTVGQCLGARRCRSVLAVCRKPCVRQSALQTHEVSTWRWHPRHDQAPRRYSGTARVALRLRNQPEGRGPRPLINVRSATARCASQPRPHLSRRCRGCP